MTDTRLLIGDCREAMRTLADSSVDAIVTDPPAGIAFMGKDWDGNKGGRDHWIAWMQGVAAEALRVLKPGGHALVWALPRTSHWTATAWENAGFEVRDRVAHVFGSGFPKGLNVVNQLITLALCQSKENVPLAVQCSKFIRVRSDEAKAPIAAALVQILPEGELALLTEIGEEAGLRVLTDMSLSELVTITGLNTVWSWNGSLGDASKGASKCITETASETITDPKIYNWLIGRHTSATTTPCSVTLRNGLKWPAISVGNSSNVSSLLSSVIQIVSALGSATSNPLLRASGTNVALKPAMEDWWLLRKPLSESTVAGNVLKHRTGALNIDASRVAFVSDTEREGVKRPDSKDSWAEWSVTNGGQNTHHKLGKARAGCQGNDFGRWPAHLLHDGSDDVLAAFPETRARGNQGTEIGGGGMYGHGKFSLPAFAGDSGSAARFFYCAKASKADRDAGLEGMPDGVVTDQDKWSVKDRRSGTGRQPTEWEASPRKNNHPTVKPTALMRYLCRLITPPGGTVLDPFTGSGSTGRGAILEGFSFIGIEQSPEYLAIAEKRIAAAENEAKPKPAKPQLSFLDAAE